MNHFTDDDLVLYHLGDAPNAPAIAKHLAGCESCSATSDSIAETLRVFSADRVPTPNYEASWQRVRGNLLVLPPQKKTWLKKIVLVPAFGTLAALLLISLFVVRHHIRQHNQYAFNRPGPLTLQPREEVDHLDAAERLLTTVNHTSGSLDDITRTDAHQLALRNADFVTRAQQRGDYAEASTLEDLGRVLTNIEHQPRSHGNGVDLRIEMNTDGLLLNIRILRQSDTQ